MMSETSQGGAAARLFQTDFPPQELAARRQRVLEAIGAEAVAVLQGGPPVRGFEAFRQSNDFYYLCGVEVPQCTLLLDGRDGTTRLYLPPPESTQPTSEGENLATLPPETVQRLTGVDAVQRTEELAGHLAEARTVFVPHRPAEGRAGTRGMAQHAHRLMAWDPWDGRVPREGRFLALLRARLPRAEVRDLSPILDALRLIKSPREVELCRRAARLSGLALLAAMRSTRPGVMEYQLGAIAAYVFRVHGARGEAYAPIIAGGANAWFGHYSRNDQPLRDGDLVLMDCAPDYHYYTSDIGRMWPVNGRYGDWQRELYGFVVAYHQALLERIRPGALVARIAEEAAGAMAPVVENTSWSRPAYEAAARKMLTFGGHLSHPVGMAVHDVGSPRAQPLAPGVVFTVDPQLWVPEERLYIRCEDTVVVTDEGIENLTGFAPVELDATEALVGRGGLLQAYPPEFA